jgi:hypothetical protein
MFKHLQIPLQILKQPTQSSDTPKLMDIELVRLEINQLRVLIFTEDLFLCSEIEEKFSVGDKISCILPTVSNLKHDYKNLVTFVTM